MGARLSPYGMWSTRSITSARWLDARHAGLGTDFDGGFGMQVVPAEIDTIADLQKLVPLLADKGYNPDDITAILGGNWLRHLLYLLPEGL